MPAKMPADSQSEGPSDCPVCLEIRVPARRTAFRCTHKFCNGCTAKFPQKRVFACPLCRAEPKKPYRQPRVRSRFRHTRSHPVNVIDGEEGSLPRYPQGHGGGSSSLDPYEVMERVQAYEMMERNRADVRRVLLGEERPAHVPALEFEWVALAGAVRSFLETSGFPRNGPGSSGDL